MTDEFLLLILYFDMKYFLSCLFFLICFTFSSSAQPKEERVSGEGYWAAFSLARLCHREWVCRAVVTLKSKEGFKVRQASFSVIDGGEGIVFDSLEIESLREKRSVTFAPHLPGKGVVKGSLPI